MVAGATSCTCDACGTVCRGRFNGCPAVWARGPLAIGTTRFHEPVVLAGASTDGRLPDDVRVPDFSLGPRPVDTPLPPLVPLARPVVQPPAPQVVAVRPRTVKLVTARKPIPRITRTAEPAPGLDGLRDRLDSLRGELRSLGDVLGARSRD
jgi:hypothetical protein